MKYSWIDASDLAIARDAIVNSLQDGSALSRRLLDLGYMDQAKLSLLLTSVNELSRLKNLRWNREANGLLRSDVGNADIRLDLAEFLSMCSKDRSGLALIAETLLKAADASHIVKSTNQLRAAEAPMLVVYSEDLYYHAPPPLEPAIVYDMLRSTEFAVNDHGFLYSYEAQRTEVDNETIPKALTDNSLSYIASEVKLMYLGVFDGEGYLVASLPDIVKRSDTRSC